MVSALATDFAEISGRSPVAARLDQVVLMRLATTAKPPGSTHIAAGLKALAPSTFDDARWLDTIAASESRLIEAGELDARRRPTQGLDELTVRLGLPPRVSWKAFHDKVLPGLGLGIKPDDTSAFRRLAGRDEWAAATVGRALALWHHGPPPRLNAVCDALVWKTLGLPGVAKRTPPELRAHFVRQVIPNATGSPERMIHMLAARAAGAIRADLRALRAGLSRRWLTGQEWNGGSDIATAPTFAAAVRAAAEQATDGVFGARKVFISSVWHTLRAQPAFRSLTLDEFKRQLVSAHKAGTVTLVRADLSAAMDAELLRESEVTHLEARYHFVERGGTP